jgi:hypothetical protein
MTSGYIIITILIIIFKFNKLSKPFKILKKINGIPLI